MSYELEEKTREFLEKLQKNPTILEFQKVQKELLKNPELLKTIEYFHTLNLYDPKYKETKRQLFENETYKKYLELNQEITYWTYEMSGKLKEITKGDGHENH